MSMVRGCAIASSTAGDLVENDPLDVDAANGVALFEFGQDVPGDRLSLAIRVGRQIEVLGPLEGIRDLADVPDGVGVDLVGHLEVFVGTHRTVPRRQVADVTIGGENDEVVAKVLVDGPGLCR
jgi:hypothetical protein